MKLRDWLIGKRDAWQQRILGSDTDESCTEDMMTATLVAVDAQLAAVEAEIATINAVEGALRVALACASCKLLVVAVPLLVPIHVMIAYPQLPTLRLPPLRPSSPC